MSDKEEEKALQKKLAQEKEVKKEIDDRKKAERLSLAHDLGWLAAQHKKVIATNPYVSHEIESEEQKEKVITETDLLSESWLAGFNSFKGNVK